MLTVTNKTKPLLVEINVKSASALTDEIRTRLSEIAAGQGPLHNKFDLLFDEFGSIVRDGFFDFLESVRIPTRNAPSKFFIRVRDELYRLITQRALDRLNGHLPPLEP